MLSSQGEGAEFEQKENGQDHPRRRSQDMARIPWLYRPMPVSRICAFCCPPNRRAERIAGVSPSVADRLGETYGNHSTVQRPHVDSHREECPANWRYWVFVSLAAGAVVSGSRRTTMAPMTRVP